jgi:hypothetical protein
MVPTISLSVDSPEDPAASCGFRRLGLGAVCRGSGVAHVAWGRWVKARASSCAGRVIHPLGKTYLLELGRVDTDRESRANCDRLERATSGLLLMSPSDGQL